MYAKNITTLLLRNACVVKNSQLSRNLYVTPVNRDIIKIQSTEDFKRKVLASKDTVIVDFFATWCNPCKLLTPRLESILAENKGKIHLAKIDIDEQTDLALNYDVSSVPVLVAVRNGREVQRLVGLQDTDKLRKWIEGITKPAFEEAKA